MARPGDNRRRGVVPNDLRRRIDGVCVDFGERMTARMIANTLEGVHPTRLDDGERARLRSVWGEAADRALEVLAAVGYGEAPARRGRAERADGARREQRLRGVVGKLPRALALRLPTTADTHRTGRNDGRDRWGHVACSLTLRAAHLGALAAAGGLWHARAHGDEGHVDLTAGELVQLLTGRQRIGGKDVAWIHGVLADLETLDIEADVKAGADTSSPDAGREPSAAHRIPGRPIERIERRIGDRWVAASEYADEVQAAGENAADELVELRAAERAGVGGRATIRIHLAEWFRAELGHPTRRPVFINFAVWAHLRPQSQRLYAFLQAHGRDDYDGRIYFYLGDPTLYTLSLRSARRDRAEAIIRHDLAAVWHADRRCRDGSGFRRHKHANTRLPAFACDAARVPSRPTAEALASKTPAKRPGGLRGACRRLHRLAILGPGAVAPEHPERRIAGAREEVELVRREIARALARSDAGPGDLGSHSAPHRRAPTNRLRRARPDP